MNDSTEKTCSKCGVAKPLTEFHRRASSPDGHVGGCKACVRVYGQARQQRDRDRLNAISAVYYAEHRKEISERLRSRRASDPDWADEGRRRARAWYQANREQAIARTSEWRKANPEKFAEYQRRWRASNPEKVRELSRLRMARLRAEDPEAVRERIRTWRQANRELVRAAKAAWADANYERHRSASNERNRRYKSRNPDKRRDDYQRRRALKAQVSFGKIDLAELWELQGGACGICGTQLDRELRWPDPLSPSIDHIIPLSKGGPHSQDNVRWTCLVCNLVKGSKLPD